MSPSQKANVSAPVVQTTLFQAASIDEAARQYAFQAPMQALLVESFPAVFNMVALSTVFGAKRGQLGCTHVVEIDGLEIYRHEHPPSPIPLDETGIAFHLGLENITVTEPCVVTVKTVLSNGSKGQDIPLRVLSQSRSNGNLNLKG